MEPKTSQNYSNMKKPSNSSNLCLKTHTNKINFWIRVQDWLLAVMASCTLTSDKWQIKIREGVKKRFLGDLSQMCLPTHPPQGFCEIWENERWNLGRKGRFSGWFEGFGPCLGISLPTHPHLGKISKKNVFLLLPF